MYDYMNMGMWNVEVWIIWFLNGMTKRMWACVHG